MADRPVWKIHSGRNGDGGLLESWEQQGIVTVGFSRSEPVSEMPADELVATFASRGHRGFGQQIVTFRDVIEVGDMIVAPARQLGICVVGIVTGPYSWSPTSVAGDHHHFRPVQWIEQINLSELPPDVDRTLRHRWTISRLSGDDARWFLDVVEGRSAARRAPSRTQAHSTEFADGSDPRVWDTPVGALLTRDARMSRYGGAKYGGIEPSRTTPNVFVYSDPSRGEAFGYNFDGWNEDQTAFLYTGEGRVGDQLMQDGNRAILEHGEHRRALRLFIARGKVKGTSTKLHEYIGEFSVDADEPYTIADAPDENGELRTVVVFRLHPVAGVEGEASDSSKAVGVRGGQVADLIDLEAVNAGTFDVGATGATTAERRESALVQRYVAHLVSEGHRVRRWRLCPPGVLQALVTDIYDEDTNELYEAKGTATRVAVRQAIGQLFDYRRHIPRPLSRLALLLPHRPNDDLVDLITGLGMACVYEGETDEFQRVEGAET